MKSHRLLNGLFRSIKNWWHRRYYVAGYWYRHVPYALHILRDEGLVELLKRVRLKLKVWRYRPVVQYVAIQADIGPLSLHACPPDKVPHVSIVIPVYGQHGFTFNCLRSLEEYTRLDDVEIIVVDDASPEPLAAVLSEVQGARFVRNETNLGFIGSCRHGAGLARGEYLILLNNDVQVTQGWLEALLNVFRLRPDAGLVGARLIFPNGRLQEAGGIVWRDGSAGNWGQDDDPERPPYRYLREADYCSGACLAIKRQDWEALDGFDQAYMPAYYEDTDLAFRIREIGKRVYYQPEATIIHYEGVSSGTNVTRGVKRFQVVNSKKFFTRWKSVLASHREDGVNPEIEVDRAVRGRVLVVEACMVMPDQDSGSVRMFAIFKLLVGLGYKVSFVADSLEYQQPYVRDLQQIGVEVWHAPYIKSVAQLLEERGSQYDLIIFCRYYVGAAHIKQARLWAPQAKIVLDTVDLHYVREQRLADIENSPSLKQAAEKTRQQELKLVAQADVTLVVSPVEKVLLAQELPNADVRVLSNIHEPQPPGPTFSERRGLLFVGGFRHPPNVDAMKWFLEEIWPLVHGQRPGLTVTVVGSNMPDTLKALAVPGVDMRGFVPDMEPLLKSARVSIAPLRYGSGVKGKINQAMAWGVPVVATPMAAEGMGLLDGSQILIAETAQDFANSIIALYSDEALWNRLSAGGRENVERNFSSSHACSVLTGLLSPTP